MNAMSTPGKKTPTFLFEFIFERPYINYFKNFFLAIFIITFGILWLSQSDRQWSLYATIFFGFSLFSLVISGLKWGRSVITGARVFRHMQTPISLWQSWQRAILTRASILPIALFGAISLLELNHLAILPCSALLALIFLSVTSGFALSLILNNYLNKRCYALILIFMLYLIYVLQLTDNAGMSSWLNEAWWWHIPAIASWPLLVLGSLIYWGTPPSQQGKTLLSQLKELRLVHTVRHFYLRFTPLEVARTGEKKGQSIAPGKFVKSIGLMWLLFLSPMLAVDWHAAVTLPHLIFLLVIATFSTSYIVVKDLHWRYVLLPNHFQHGRIANHLFISNMLYYGCWSLIVFFTLFGLKMLMVNVIPMVRTPSAAIPLVNLALGYLALGVELITAFCIGLAIRGSQKPERCIFYLFLAGLIIAAVTTIYFYMQKQSPFKAALFTMNANYMVAVTLLGIVALIYANRLWTRERLLAFL